MAATAVEGFSHKKLEIAVDSTRASTRLTRVETHRRTTGEATGEGASDHDILPGCTVEGTYETSRLNAFDIR